MDKLLVLFTFLGSAAALIFAVITAKRVLRFPEGTDTMKKISAWVKSGANAYLKRQYFVVAVFFAAMFVILLVMALCKLLTIYVPFAFVTGGFSPPFRDLSV